MNAFSYSGDVDGRSSTEAAAAALRGAQHKRSSVDIRILGILVFLCGSLTSMEC